MKEDRQRAILELVRGGPVHTQNELARALGERGFAATQATVHSPMGPQFAVSTQCCRSCLVILASSEADAERVHFQFPFGVPADSE